MLDELTHNNEPIYNRLQTYYSLITHTLSGLEDNIHYTTGRVLMNIDSFEELENNHQDEIIDSLQLCICGLCLQLSVIMRRIPR